MKKIGDVFKGPFRKGDHVTISGGDGESVKATITDYDIGGGKYEVMLQKNYDESNNLSDKELCDLVYSILTNEDYSADAMIAEIGELVDEESTGLGSEIYDILTDEELSSEGMVSKLEELVDSVDESSNDDWFGIKSAKFIYHGDWSDPEVQYDGVSLNYYDVEAILLDEYREEHPEDKNDKGFDDWMRMPEQKSSIQSALDILVQGGCGEPIDE